MKLPRLLVALSVHVLLMTACQGTQQPEEVVVADTHTAYMTATADNQEWIADSINAGYAENSFIIRASNDYGSTIVLELYGKDLKPGIYPIRKGRMQAATYVASEKVNDTYYAPAPDQVRQAGVINISLINKEYVEGSFSFNASNMADYKEINNGRFGAKIIEISKPL
jgi:hypothetical protein